MSKLLLTITLLSLTAVFADLDDELNSQLTLLLEEPAPFHWTEPVWYQRYALTSPEVNRCYKRPFAPFSGQSCGSKTKTCYFEDQQCPDGLLHPVQKCRCHGQMWNCVASNCPTCPAEEPTSGATCSGNLKCHYGEDKCCGKVHSKIQCDCVNGAMVCLPVEACLLPECFFDDYNYLVGETCDFALATIKDNHPAMNAVCASQAPTDGFDNNRVVLVTDASNMVIAVPELG